MRRKTTPTKIRGEGKESGDKKADDKGNGGVADGQIKESVQIGRPRFTLSGGLAYSPLPRRSFRSVKGFKRHTQGNPSGNGDADIVEFDENSSRFTAYHFRSAIQEQTARAYLSLLAKHCSRNVPNALRMRVFTTLGGSLRCAAISLCRSPEKYANSNIRRSSGESAQTPARTTSSRSAMTAQFAG